MEKEKPTDNEILIFNIRLARFKSGFSQEYMAYHLGISQNAYSRLERGETYIKVERLTQIAKIFNLSIHDLLPPIKDNASIDISLFTRMIGKLKSFFITFLPKKKDLPDV